MLFAEVLERAIGPLLFCLGIICVLVFNTNLNSMLDSAKEEYSKGVEYSQEHEYAPVRNTVRRDGILASVMAGVTVPVRIEDGLACLVSIEPGTDGSYRVTVLEQPFSESLATCVFDKSIREYREFPKEFVNSKEYYVSYEYSVDGALSTVVYTSVNE